MNNLSTTNNFHATLTQCPCCGSRQVTLSPEQLVRFVQSAPGAVQVVSHTPSEEPDSPAAGDSQESDGGTPAGGGVQKPRAKPRKKPGRKKAKPVPLQMTPTGKEVATFLKEKGIGTAAAGKALGISEGAVRNLINGNPIRKSTIEKAKKGLAKHRKTKAAKKPVEEKDDPNRPVMALRQWMELEDLTSIQAAEKIGIHEDEVAGLLVHGDPSPKVRKQLVKVFKDYPAEVHLVEPAPKERCSEAAFLSKHLKKWMHDQGATTRGVANVMFIPYVDVKMAEAGLKLPPPDSIRLFAEHIPEVKANLSHLVQVAER